MTAAGASAMTAARSGESAIRRNAYILGEHRLWLSRAWGAQPAERFVLWVMLNPSTADAEIDDPTIRRCIGFTRSWGYDALVVVNLYSLRTPDPRAVWRHPKPVHLLNDAEIDRLARVADRVVAAWGAAGGARFALEERAARVTEIVSRYRPLVCLGTSLGGAPRHPLYVRADVAVEPWPAPHSSEPKR